MDARRAILTGVLGIALVAGVVAAIGEATSFGDMTAALGRADRGWLAASLAGLLLAYVGYVAAYRDVARVADGPRLSPWAATRVVVLGLGAFVAAASAGALGVDYWALHRAGQGPHQAARRVLALNTLEWAFLSVAAFAAALACVGDVPLAMALAWIAAVPAAFAAAAFLTHGARGRRLATRPEGRPVRSALADAIAGVLLVRRLGSQPLRHAQALLGLPVYWAGDVFTLWAALRAFDVHLAIAPLVLAYASAYILTSLPLPAGGSGGVEAGLAFALHAVGAPLAPALLGTLVYRFVSVWLPVVPALALVPRIKPLRDELARVG